MKRWILRLYPQAWRERYGAEVEALLEDAPARRSDNWDLLKGALAMRLERLPLLVMMTVVGALLPWAIAWTWRQASPLYESRAVLHVAPGERAQTNQVVNLAAQKALSRKSVAELIHKHRLYEAEAARLPLEDVIEFARKDTRLIVTPGSGQVEVSFRHADAETARRVNTDLATAMASELKGTQDVVVGPGQPAGYNREALRFLSLVGVLTMYLAWRFYGRNRRAEPAKP